MSARFNIKQADSAAVIALQRALGIPRFIAATMVARGIDTPQAANEFLSPSLERDWRNPYEIPGMQDVVDGLETAVKDGKRILVFGDFDLDGISATTTLTRALRTLGAEAVPFVPLRNEEGYGLTVAAIERLLELAPDVVITVDCGIACREEVKVLQHHGVEVFVTDHHEPADLVPTDVPVCDPKLDADSPSSILAGVGVALKVVQALGARFGQPHLWREYTDFATLGTVADLMPMRAGNRALVADGVARMNNSPRPCIAALLQSSGAADKPVAATSLSFSIIPRLNAAGRMGDAQLALDMLLTDEFEEAQEKAAELESVNVQRRAIEAELAEIASLQAEEAYNGQRALVVYGDGWHEGVKGIVASRLVRTYGVPVILFTVDENGEARGSGRSVGQVNLFKAVESCSDLLTRFGGHEAAVGVTLPVSKLTEFTKRLCEYMDSLPEDCFHPRLDIDACVDLGEMTMENVSKLEMLAPFGQENRPPRYLARDVLLIKCRAVGADRNHFSCTLTDGKDSVAGIMFHCSDIEMLMQCCSVVNAAFEVQIDEWRGRKSVKALLKSLAPVRPCGALQACLDPAHVSFVRDLYATSDDQLCQDCPECDEDLAAIDAEREKNRAQWEEAAKTDPDGLNQAIVRAFIGDGTLFDSQKQVIDALEEHESVLAVMATGRGKSLVFQMHAAKQALADGQASLFVYPLRALISDQAFHINEALTSFGIVAETLTGASTPEERRNVFQGLSDGSVDIVLTTPEFLEFHIADFCKTGRIGFVVMDEAHHISTARGGKRTAYARVGSAIEKLGSPTVLALTATASPRIAAEIDSELHIQRHVLDKAQRDNMGLDDQRNLKRKEQYLANLAASGEKIVIYVNSRQQSVALARMLRKQLPQMASLIGFYNAGLSRNERNRVEELFRQDALCVLVSTSAFGEGVNIPNIRHVVLFHMPFNEVEFNQMSGRAGRDGQPAVVHLLFGAEDVSINERLLEEATPDHDTMGQVYRELRAMQQKAGDGWFIVTVNDLVEACAKRVLGIPITADGVRCAVAVFRELGLIELRTDEGDASVERRVHLRNTGSKVELTDSARYREGLDETEIFHEFRDWVMNASADNLQFRISRPILPDQKEEG